MVELDELGLVDAPASEDVSAINSFDELLSWVDSHPWSTYTLLLGCLGIEAAIGHVVVDNNGRLPSLARLAEWAQVLGFPFVIAAFILAVLAYRNTR